MQSASFAQEDVPPVLHIEAASNASLDEPLEFTWIISNPGAKPVYIYTSLLETERSAFAELNIHEEKKVIEVGFLRSELIAGLPPYSFPKASFKPIDPGQSLRGRFVSEFTISELKGHKVSGDKLETIKLTPSPWNINGKIAYGYEIESVQKALEQSLKEGQEHPFNPINRWQKVVYSELVNVTFHR
jgi:hypothetical protein